jgi:hypothetical protein
MITGIYLAYYFAISFAFVRIVGPSNLPQTLIFNFLAAVSLAFIKIELGNNSTISLLTYSPPNVALNPIV